MNDPQARLIFELSQIHEYARHEIATYVSWFSFFLTLLLGAMGWSLKTSLNSDGVVRTPTPFFCMVFLFTIQLSLSIWATQHVRDDLHRADERGKALLALVENSSPPSYVAASPIPNGFHLALQGMHLTLISNLIFWLFVARLVWLKRGKPLSQKSAD